MNFIRKRRPKTKVLFTDVYNVFYLTFDKDSSNI